MANPRAVFLGIKGSVLALDLATGQRLWTAALKGQGFVSVLVEGDRVIAGTHGEVFCLDAATGRQLWHDGLRGYGYGLLSLATPGACTNPLAAQAEETQRQQTAAAAASSSPAT